MSDYIEAANDLEKILSEWGKQIEEADIYGKGAIEEIIDCLKSKHESWMEQYACDGFSSEFEQHSVWNKTQLGLR